MRNALLIGAAGMLGSAFRRRMNSLNTFWTRDDVDLCNLEKVRLMLEEVKPSMIINCAAYTDVDEAERDDREAMKINADLPRELALYCKRNDIPLIHFSTDYVFDGAQTFPYKEIDVPNPINVYGQTKLIGEDAIRTVNCKHMIFRTSWLFDGISPNFVTKILSLAKLRYEIHVVTDQTGCPTYAPFLATQIMRVLNNKKIMGESEKYFPSNTYHVCGKDSLTRYEFARTIVALAKTLGIGTLCRVYPTTSEQQKTEARRPKHSALKCDRVKHQLKFKYHDWKLGLHDALTGILVREKRLADRLEEIQEADRTDVSKELHTAPPNPQEEKPKEEQVLDRPTWIPFQ